MRKNWKKFKKQKKTGEKKKGWRKGKEQMFFGRANVFWYTQQKMRKNWKKKVQKKGEKKRLKKRKRANVFLVEQMFFGTPEMGPKKIFFYIELTRGIVTKLRPRKIRFLSTQERKWKENEKTMKRQWKDSVKKWKSRKWKNARVGNDAKSGAKCVVHNGWELFSLQSDLGPRRLCAEKYVIVMSTVPGCDVTNWATTLQGFNKHASSRREAVSDSRGVPRCTEKKFTTLRLLTCVDRSTRPIHHTRIQRLP